MDPSVRHTHTHTHPTSCNIQEYGILDTKTTVIKTTSCVSCSTGVEDGALPELYFEWSMMNPISILVSQRRCPPWKPQVEGGFPRESAKKDAFIFPPNDCWRFHLFNWSTKYCRYAVCKLQQRIQKISFLNSSWWPIHDNPPEVMWSQDTWRSPGCSDENTIGLAWFTPGIWKTKQKTNHPGPRWQVSKYLFGWAFYSFGDASMMINNWDDHRIDSNWFIGMVSSFVIFNC